MRIPQTLALALCTLFVCTTALSIEKSSASDDPSHSRPKRTIGLFLQFLNAFQPPPANAPKAGLVPASMPLPPPAAKAAAPPPPPAPPAPPPPPPPMKAAPAPPPPPPPMRYNFFGVAFPAFSSLFGFGGTAQPAPPPAPAAPPAPPAPAPANPLPPKSAAPASPNAIPIEQPKPQLPIPADPTSPPAPAQPQSTLPPPVEPTDVPPKPAPEDDSSDETSGSAEDSPDAPPPPPAAKPAAPLPANTDDDETSAERAAFFRGTPSFQKFWQSAQFADSPNWSVSPGAAGISGSDRYTYNFHPASDNLDGSNYASAQPLRRSAPLLQAARAGHPTTHISSSMATSSVKMHDNNVEYYTYHGDQPAQSGGQRQAQTQYFGQRSQRSY